MFRHGPLTKENAQEIANRISEIFKGKILSVASYTVDSVMAFDGIKLETDIWLNADGNDKNKEFVQVSTDHPTLWSISFNCGGYFYCFITRLEKGKSHNDFDVPYFDFGNNQMVIKWRVDGCLRLHTFKEEREMANDPSEYNQSVLDAHFPPVKT